MTIANIEGWTEKKKILLILAHPDDPEFFCGGMVARWCAMGHEVRYCLITKGQRGTQDINLSTVQIEETRTQEQKKAAGLLGVANVRFLDFMDGDLTPNLQLRESIVRVIREEKPDILVTSDPQNLFPAENRINHPDHRAAGQVVLDAVFPAAGSPRFFVKEAGGVPLPAHQVKEVWLTLTQQPNLAVDLTEYLDTRLNAIVCHLSQLPDTPEIMKERMRARYKTDSDNDILQYFEKFKRIVFPN